jgi:hypothetical protein
LGALLFRKECREFSNLVLDELEDGEDLCSVIDLKDVISAISDGRGLPEKFVGALPKRYDARSLTEALGTASFHLNLASLYREAIRADGNRELIRKVALGFLKEAETLGPNSSTDLRELGLAVIEKAGTGWIPAEKAAALLKRLEGLERLEGRHAAGSRQ